MASFSEFLRTLFGKQGISGASATIAVKTPPANEAAITLAWAFREMFKYRDKEGELSPWNELGWRLSQELSSCAHWRSADAYIADPLGLRSGMTTAATARCEPLVRKLSDPVITALWQLGTLRALSDLLAHLVLRAEQPGLLRWNTADHVKAAHGIDLYAINAAYVEQIQAAAQK